MIRKTWLVVGITLITAALAQADGNNYGSAAYWTQGAGSRAAGMGGAFVALADDATAGYWNPAGLGQMDLYLYQAALQYVFLQDQMSSSYLSYSFQLPEIGAFSVSWINFSIAGLEGRDDLGLVTQNFGSSENTIWVSYGRKMYEWVKGLSLGASLKFLHQGVGEYQAVGHGLDVGVLWQPFLQWDHTIGLNVQNLFQRVYWQTGEGTLDPSLVNGKVGVALKFFPSQQEVYFNHLITAVDLEFSEYYRLGYRLGAEYWYQASLGLRAGFSGQEVSFGASYRPEYYEVDYAFLYDLSEMSRHQHRVTLMLRFK